MKRRTRRHAKSSSSSSGSGEAYAVAAAREVKDKRDHQQQQQRTSSVSSGDEISATLSGSSSEESTDRPSRPPKKERRRNIHAMVMPDVKSSFEPGKQHQVQQKKSSNVGDVSSGLLQGPNQEQQIKHSGGSSDRPVSNSESDVQVATLEVGWDFSNSCLDHAKSSISTQPKVETKKPKSSSGEPSSITHDEDERSGKNTSCGDLSNLVAQEEDGQHSGNIGAPAVEDHKESKEIPIENAQALLDMDDDAISAKFHFYAHMCRRILPEYCNPFPMPSYEEDEQTKVYEQLALYRIRGYQLLLKYPQLVELDDESLKMKYSSTDLCRQGYFKCYESDYLDWYFDRQLCMDPDFDNYQRLVLHDCMGKYLDWDYYQKVCNTYDEDMAYVRYCEALEKEIKWIEDHRKQNTDKDKWSKVKVVAKIQGLQIAAASHRVPMILVILAINEFICKIESHYDFYEYKVCKFFEIWKLTAKQKMGLKEAYLQVLGGRRYPCGRFESQFYASTAGIDETASDDKGRQHIMEGLLKVVPSPKTYLDYIKDKIDIAKDILLIER